MNQPIFKGACTALITPFTDNGIDLPAFERLIDSQIQSGIQALVVLGTTGEPPTMTPQEKKAAAAMFKGEQYFAKDSFNLALNGNGADYEGFEAIIDQYGSTSAGNLAKAYAGICYFKMGDNEKALDLLKSFSGSDDMISPAITGLIGDCYVNMGNVK